ncbi:MalY/PatB family protein [Paenibacillus abyssi]|uniref:cysteine-S-conjugate beta-lyase n=1 Tax=Paenibacillus abyssi TaxID=1340531 RepID=A0A917CRB6_9BACL|nr:MalY/PatB family protein [Paenibacillus abyssi]GGF94742.1 cystathionine beta-lyase [Paenibacillus abyssi]
MGFNFDQVPNRRNTHSYKWDQSEKLFGDPDILPLWVADMDFPSPPAIKEALIKRAEQGVYGYTFRSEKYVDAIIEWYRKRHGWELSPSCLTDVPGVVTSLSLCVELFSEPEGAVILQSPVYYPFYDVIKMNGRRVANNPLLLKSGRYEMDFEHLESLMKDGARLILLCSPHNPGGRVWEPEVLQQLGELCERYDVIIVSDEIHADLALPGYKHVPIASISETLAQRTITCLAPTKTFNLPGLQSSFVVIPNSELKRRFDYRLKALSLHMMHFFNNEAITAAYTEGGQWLDEMLQYLQGNVDYALSYLAEHLPEVTPMVPEGTYLLWVDCRGLGKDIQGLKELMYKGARVAFNEGSVYGAEGAGFLRINLACPRAVVEEALRRFCGAAKEIANAQ